MIGEGTHTHDAIGWPGSGTQKTPGRVPSCAGPV
jgi:hypothetical protein